MLIKGTVRSRQDSNLRGETPLDFKSNALTTRPRLLLLILRSCTMGKKTHWILVVLKIYGNHVVTSLLNRLDGLGV